MKRPGWVGTYIYKWFNSTLSFLMNVLCVVDGYYIYLINADVISNGLQTCRSCICDTILIHVELKPSYFGFLSRKTLKPNIVKHYGIFLLI